MPQDNDQLERRCPKLGSPVSFKYCRVLMDQEQPCNKVFDCWWEIFDVEGYLRGLLSVEAFDELVKCRPKPKILSIVEMIQEAKKRQE